MISQEWLNRTHSVKFQKRYRKASGEWADTMYYFPSDLALLRLVLDDAFRYVSDVKESGTEDAEPSTPFDGP